MWDLLKHKIANRGLTEACYSSLQAHKLDFFPSETKVKGWVYGRLDICLIWHQNAAKTYTQT